MAQPAVNPALSSGARRMVGNQSNGEAFRDLLRLWMNVGACTLRPAMECSARPQLALLDCPARSTPEQPEALLLLAFCCQSHVAAAPCHSPALRARSQRPVVERPSVVRPDV